MDYMLETRGLTKRFGRGDQAQDAVADVSLHIREGEVYGLLGPNGAGKSTTLKMICGMLRPTAGEILFAGHAWRREDLYAIGSLIEEAPLYPNLTARENLRVRTTLLGLPESRIDEVLAAVDLADTGKKRAGRFSMGKNMLFEKTVPTMSEKDFDSIHTILVSEWRQMYQPSSLPSLRCWFLNRNNAGDGKSISPW